MPQIFEQIRSKVLYEDNDFKIVVPYNMSAICNLSPKWCTSTNKARTAQIFTGKGSAMIVTDKKGKYDFILVDNDNIPFGRSGKYSIYQRTSYNPISAHKFFSQYPKMVDYLNLKYDIKQRIKFDMPFSEDDLESYSKTNDFSETVYGIIKGTIEPDVLIDFLGDDLREYEEYSRESENEVELTPSGIRFHIDTDEYIFNFLGLGDDSWVVKTAMRVYYESPYDEVSGDELDYMSCWFDDEGLDKLKKIYKLMGKEPKDDCGGYDDGEINNFFANHFSNEWDRVASDILTSIGYGLAGNRADATKETINDETTFEFEMGINQTQMDLSYEQLLYIIHVHEVTNLSDILKERINEIDFSLSDSWYDTYEWGDEATKEVEDELNMFLDGILEEAESGGLQERANNLEEFEKITKELGFNSRWGRNEYESEDKRVLIYGINMKNNKIQIQVQKKEDGNYTARNNYVITPQELSDYVLSDQLFEGHTKSITNKMIQEVIHRVVNEETNDKVHNSMVKFLVMFIKEIKEVNGNYYFLENPDDKYSKIKYEQDAKIVYHYYGLNEVLSRIYGKELVESVGIDNVVKRYVEDTLNVEVSDINRGVFIDSK